MRSLFVIICSACVVGSLCRGQARRLRQQSLEYFYCGQTPIIPPPSEPCPGCELLHIQVFIRHGDRMIAGQRPCWPDQDTEFQCSLNTFEHTGEASTGPTGAPFRRQYMKDKNYFKGNCGAGQLTEKGAKQQLANGKALRDYYIDHMHFLPEYLHGNESAFFFMSDDSQRTIHSGQSLVQGLYPEISKADHPPIPWNITDSSTDKLHANARYCGSVQYFNDSADPVYEQHYQSVSVPLAKDIAKAMGVPDWTRVDTHHIYDCLNVYTCHGLQAPAYFTSSLIDRIRADTAFLEAEHFKFNSTAQKAVGALMGESWNTMKRVMNRTSSLKMWFISGHDTAPMMQLLIALGVYHESWVPYASMATFELYRQSDEFLVRMVYNGQEMHIPGCKNKLCTIEEYSSLLSSRVLLNEKLCGPPPDPWEVVY